MKIPLRPGRIAIILLSGMSIVGIAHADCSLTNLGIAPLNEMGFATYSSNAGGLYPGGGNTRPVVHEAAGVAIAQSLEPLDAGGNVNTNTGKIGLLSLGMSNVTQEWATKGTNHFTGQATNDPSLNPRVVIADGAIGGQDAALWTNLVATNWSIIVTQRLVSAGLTTNQVQVVWMKQALKQPAAYGAFPAHARALQSMEEQILRNAKVLFPNLKLAYVSGRTRAYETNPAALNPDPYAFESGFSVRWVVEDQLNATNNLNYNPSNGPVVVPWISWGPYLWADGLTPRGDNFIWQCADLEPDYTHPSATGGVPKVATQLLAFFKTDPTAMPWFLKKNGPGAPTCFPTASTTNGFLPLTVNFLAKATNGSAPFRDAKWTYEDGEFSTNTNTVKIFKTYGTYRARFTITDTNGNTAQGMVPVKVKAKLLDWLTAKFTATERADLTISGTSANPDGDKFPNLLEYAMGLEPQSADPAGVIRTTLTNDVVTLTFPRFKYAGDVALTLEATSDFVTWSPVPVAVSLDADPVEYLTVQESVAINAPRFFRLRAVLVPVQ